MTEGVDPGAQIPVIVLTGFLGAGKTTALAHLLREPEMRHTAVIINEFGEIPLDHELIETAREEIVEVSGGCLCCTVRGDLSRALRLLDLRRRRDQVMPFERILIETTGLADPVPILHTLLTDPMIAHGYRLSGIVTVIDAVNGMATLDRHPEAVKQAAMADLLLLSKVDLVSATESAALRRRLRGLNVTARLAERLDGATISALGPWRTDERRADVEAWLGHHEHHGDHEHHHHDPNRHDDRIRAFCLRRATPVRADGLAYFLELLTTLAGENLLRLKGLVRLAEDPDRPLVLHAVQHLVHEPVTLDAWPSADRDTRLVFIVRDLAKDRIAHMFDGLTGTRTAS